MGSIRVVVADDDATMRDALTALLHTDSRFEVVGHAATGADLVRVTSLTRPEVALVDVRMPGGGVDAVLALASGPPVVVIVVSAETAPHTLLGVLRAGARGYLVKGCIGGSLADLVARCVAGEVVLASPTGGEVLRQLLAGSDVEPHVGQLARGH